MNLEETIKFLIDTNSEEMVEFVNNPTLNFESEMWKEHPTHTGYYGSNLGRIKYYDKRKKICKIKIQTFDKRFKRFKLHIWDKKQTSLDSARFILECFNGINKTKFVDHVDSNPYHNTIDNLHYATRKENNNNPNSRKKQTHSKTTNAGTKIKQIDIETGEVLKVWDKITTAEKELNIPHRSGANIVAVCRGAQKTAYGFKWEYFNEEDLEGEIWKKHPTLDLECSNKGRVRWIQGNGRYYITFGGKHTCGYLCVQFKRKKHLVHRLVAETFLTNDNNKPQVNHIDTNIYNNAIDNLEWCNQQENMRSEKTHKKLSHKIKSIDKNGYEKCYTSIREAGREGFCCDSIRKCLKGIQDEHKGFKWEYAN